MTATFWMLVFAHLIADYPLQTTWMVENKRNGRGLIVHCFVHLLTVLALFGGNSRFLWPYALALAASHFVIDALKTAQGVRWPRWVVGPYLLDQAVHALVALLIARWIDAAHPDLILPFARNWLIVASGLLAATYVWHISERIIAWNQVDYRHEVITQMWPRMVTRALLFLVFLWLGSFFHSPTPLAAIFLPYRSGQHHRRALLTDIAVAATAALIVWLAL